MDIDDDPYPTWRRLRDEAPLYRNEELDFFALSRWDDVKPALADWKTYRSGRGTVLDIIRAGVEIPPGILLFEDPPIHERPTEQPIETAFGTVELGTCGAIRFQAIGIVEGHAAIVIDHVTRLARHVAPDCPIDEANLAYRIVLEGKPDIDCWVTPTLKDPAEAGIPHMKSGAGAMLATAMRVVNAVPHVVDAQPGLLRSLEMPLTLPRHALHAE